MDGLFYRAPENLYADDGSDGHDNDDGHDNCDNPIQGTSYRAPMIDAMTNMDNKLTDTKKSRIPKVRKAGRKSTATIQ